MKRWPNWFSKSHRRRTGATALSALRSIFLLRLTRGMNLGRTCERPFELTSLMELFPSASVYILSGTKCLQHYENTARLGRRGIGGMPVQALGIPEDSPAGEPCSA